MSDRERVKNLLESKGHSDSMAYDQKFSDPYIKKKMDRSSGEAELFNKQLADKDMVEG